MGTTSYRAFAMTSPLATHQIGLTERITPGFIRVFVAEYATLIYATLVCLLFELFWHTKNSKCRKRDFSELPYLPKDRSFKRNSVVIDPLPRSVFNQGRLMVIPGEETRRHHTQTDCHELSHLPSSLLRAHSSFLKIIHSPLLLQDGI